MNKDSIIVNGINGCNCNHCGKYFEIFAPMGTSAMYCNNCFNKTKIENYEKLEKENQELKEQINSHIDSELIVNKLIAKQDQFLKVVESVLKKHYYCEWKNACYCTSCNSHRTIEEFLAHLLQEIRKAMENEK